MSNQTKNKQSEAIEFPILSYDVVKNLPDIRNKLLAFGQYTIPEDVTVALVRSVSPPHLPQGAALNSSQALHRLLGVSYPDGDINTAGAPNAAFATDECDDDPALHRFEAVHGRDALEIALRISPYYPGFLENTLIDLATIQGVVDEVYQENAPFGQEESGKIILIDREENDPIAKRFRKEMGWSFPFYGSVDATPTYITAIARAANANPSFLDKTYVGRAGKSTMRQSLNLSIDWLLKKIASPESPFIEFKNTDPRPGYGIDCQSWRDSSYAYVHADGSRANVRDGVASFDVQVASYFALTAVATFAESDEKKQTLINTAQKLREETIAAFWVTPDNDAPGFFALGLDRSPVDGTLRQLKVRASSIAAGLQKDFLDLAKPKHQAMIDATIKQLVSSDFFTYAGIRTIAENEAAYGPTNYHTGSVWLWDTATVADRLDEQGYVRLAWELRCRVIRAISERGLFPEFVSGTQNAVEIPFVEAYARIDRERVVFLLAQAPQLEQGWTISAAYDIQRKAEKQQVPWPDFSTHERELYQALDHRITNFS